MKPHHWVFPVLAAGVLTTLNATKPIVVDDTAYLLFARHLMAHPFEPYGFELFWYSAPQPAMEILAPPVVPYWLALGMTVMGEHPLLIKLWLFPFAILLTVAYFDLTRRLAPGLERVGVFAFALSPGVLPLFNVMLDVPALALGLMAVTLFLRGCDSGKFWLFALAGLSTGLALQTKYTMATIPLVLAVASLFERQFWGLVVAGVVSCLMFVGWEGYVLAVHGQSHFLYHVQDQSASPGLGWWQAKTALTSPLLGQLAWLGLGWALVLLRCCGWSQSLVWGLGVVAGLGFIAVCLTPYSQSVLVRNALTGTPRLDLAQLVYLPLGLLVIGSIVVTVVQTLWIRQNAPHRDHSTMAWLIVWLGIELLGYYALTPFPATRRVMGLVAVLSLLCLHRLSKIPIESRPSSLWLSSVGVLGLSLFAIDTWDCRAEKELAKQAHSILPKLRSGSVWTQGHWGWQYYQDRLGAELIVPGRTRIRAGDWVILPVLPDEQGFYRPYHGEAVFSLDLEALRWETELVWDDGFPGQTIPNLYGGLVPVMGRDHPRLRVAIYQAVRDWFPGP